MKHLLLLFCFFVLRSYSQEMSISGNVQDTAAKTAVPQAVVMAVKFKDSTLVSFSRSDKNGAFRMLRLPLDTYVVVVSHPNFGDLQFFVLGNPNHPDVTLPKIILPPKTIALQEVVVIGYSEPVYRRGDTLVYNADSFKVKPNAVVEDLLKKLPGIRVDAQGKIYSEGKKVDQLLVDGDEFFGSNQTIATKNLDAKTVESVQVYDKKNTNATAEGNNETLKVMNLKLKEDSKKGYFGKVSGAGDFSNFYEGQLLANRFKKKLKLSVFSLASNTPASGFNWSDKNEYGLNALSDFRYDEETASFTGGEMPSTNRGVPRTLKTGVYFSDKFHDKTKLEFNYTYNPSELTLKTNSSSRYFLPDTVYKTSDQEENKENNTAHRFNFGITHEIDSFTKVQIFSRTSYVIQNSTRSKTTDFYTENDELTRKTGTMTTINGQTLSSTNSVALIKEFSNKKKSLNISYNNEISQNDLTSILKSSNTPFFPGLPADSIDQRKTNQNSNQTHKASVFYALPLNKRFVLNLRYAYTYALISQNIETKNFLNGEYSQENPFLTNSFQTVRNTNQGDAALVYEVKKYKITLGTKAEKRTIANTNKVTGDILSQDQQVLLPYFKSSYNLKDTRYVQLNYFSSSRMPDINQIQPVPDNSNPNQVRVGNPALQPAFSHTIRTSFYSFKPISGQYIFCEAYYGFTTNDFSNSIRIDSIGRSNVQTVNVQGNHRSGADLNFYLPLFSKLMEISPSFSLLQTKTISYLNGMENTTANTTIGPRIEWGLTMDDFEFYIGPGYTYNIPHSSINAGANAPYTSTMFNSSAKLTVLKKIQLSSEANYTRNSQRAQGYNIDYLIWNAEFTVTCLKKDNLIVGFSVNDLLNQNTSLTRTVQDNFVSDIRTNAIGRYLLLRATYKFTSGKTE